MKTTKYWVEVECCDIITLQKMYISKKEFNRQLMELRANVILTEGCETCTEKVQDFVQEYDTYTAHFYQFNTACCITVLCEMKTKEGYKFV